MALVGAGATLAAQSRINELNDAGWKALAEGNSRRAAALFEEALGLRPDEPVLLAGAGAAAHAEGKDREGIARLRRALELNPRLTGASVILGRILFDGGDAEAAIKTYEAALKHAPGDRVLTDTLVNWRRETEVHRGFEERRYDRFRVMYEGRADESLAGAATSILNTAFYRIGEKLGGYPSEPIVTVLYTEQQFRDITRAPDWAGGRYDGRIRIPAAGAGRDPALFEEVLVHELTHAVIAGIARRGVPTWLNEGLAQYFDGSDPQAARARMKRLGAYVPLARLESGFNRFSAAEAQVAYDESLLAVGVMADRAGFGWSRLLARLGAGERFADIISSFGFSYEDLEAPFMK
jgi:tetratricopeptide (TPR) repeat protein